MRCRSSVTRCAKVTLALLNIWVLCVILVVALGKWRFFDGDLSINKFYDDSHLVVRRELKQESNPGMGGVSTNQSLGASKHQKLPVAPKAGAHAGPAAAAPGPAAAAAGLSPMQQDWAERVSGMRQWCARLHPRTRDVGAIPAARLGMVMVDRKHKLLFCQIPGVAQNDWRRIFIYLTGKVNVTSHLKISAYDAHSKHAPLIKKFSDFNPQERRAIVKDSLKVVFVRDPFERLVSTFQNKFQARYSKYFHEAFGRKIVARYRTNATAQSKKDGNDVTFNEFVRFVVDSERESDAPLNEHWERYYKQCHPCVMGYDFVGKFESLADDTAEVLGRAKVLGRIKAPFVADTFRNSEKSLKSFFQTVNPADLKRLWNIYYPDYNLFNYQYPQVLQSLFEKTFHDY